MLIQHPSVSGLSDGTGRSGSTGGITPGDGGSTSPRSRTATNSDSSRSPKINYGPTGDKITLRWERGVFVPENDAATSPHRAAAENQLTRNFCELLDKATAQGRSVGPNSGPSYAPAKVCRRSRRHRHQAEGIRRGYGPALQGGKITNGVQQPARLDDHRTSKPMSLTNTPTTWLRAIQTHMQAMGQTTLQTGQTPLQTPCTQTPHTPQAFVARATGLGRPCLAPRLRKGKRPHQWQHSNNFPSSPDLLNALCLAGLGIRDNGYHWPRQLLLQTQCRHAKAPRQEVPGFAGFHLIGHIIEDHGKPNRQGYTRGLSFPPSHWN